jgi:hypothetical protein
VTVTVKDYPDIITVANINASAIDASLSSVAAIDTQASANGSAGGDIHVRGSQGRGRQTDNGPAYEMLQMREGDDNV